MRHAASERPRLSPAGRRPAISVILPAYRSAATVAGCLEALAGQTFRGFETVLVDSSPDGETERIVGARFPWVRYHRSPRRLLPHGARNLGAELARAELLVFTDPDVYAHPEWLARLLAARRAGDEVVVGALACYGRRWLDHGVHLCKFGKWLPAGVPRRVDMSPTANMLVARREFLAAGRFPADLLLGDVILSRRLEALGQRLWFEPHAVVEHHHLHTLRTFLAERFRRGRLYGELRAGWWQARPFTLGGMLLATVLPVRLARVLGLVAVQSARAGQSGRYLATLPLVSAGHAASLAGEALAFSLALARRWEQTPLPHAGDAGGSGK